MAYRLVLADRAKADADSIYEWVTSHAPSRGSEWFKGLLICLRSLEELPMRCPLARESVMAGREIRCLHFGKRRNVYRVLYDVDERAGVVRVLHIRHGALLDEPAEELEWVL